MTRPSSGRAAALALAAGLAIGTALAAPARAQEGGAIRGGDHDGFSRIVLRVDATSEWTLSTVAGRAVLTFPGKRLAFDTRSTFELLPRTRIGAVGIEADDAGTRVTVDLACDCRVSTVAVLGRYLALDVADGDFVPPPALAALQTAAPGTPPATPAETPAERTIREDAAVASAENVLIRQIERAAGQGIIMLAEVPAPASDSAPAPDAVPASDAAPAPDAASASDAAAAPETTPAADDLPQTAAAPVAAEPETTAAAPVVPIALTAETPVAAEAVADLLDLDQIEALTVFDRDRAERAGVAEPEALADCLPDAAFDLTAWASDRPFVDQRTDLQGRLVGEFDAPDAGALTDLVRLHLRYGLGAEARALMAAFPAVLADAALMADLARVADGAAADAEGPLAAEAACPGAHGLWLALGQVAPAFHDLRHFAGVQAAFGGLPGDVRTRLAPLLVARLLDAGAVAAARGIHDTALRSTAPSPTPLRIAGARLVAAEGDVDAALAALGSIAESQDADAEVALAQLVRLAIDAEVAVPERFVVDLRAALLRARGTADAGGFRALLAETLAARHALGAALAEIRDGLAEAPDDPRFTRLAVAILAAADPVATGRAGYAEAALGARDLVPAGPEGDPARLALARNLIDLGLPSAARDFVAPAAAREVPQAVLLLAEAGLRSGDTAAAQAALADTTGPVAADVRARAFAADGDFAEAAATLDAAELRETANRYAWPAGDWDRTRATSAEAGRVTLATYMAARTADAVAAPAADPSGLSADAAFVEPVPPLERPSLDAARRLLAAGDKIGAYVTELLAQE